MNKCHIGAVLTKASRRLYPQSPFFQCSPVLKIADFDDRMRNTSDDKIKVVAPFLAGNRRHSNGHLIRTDHCRLNQTRSGLKFEFTFSRFTMAKEADCSCGIATHFGRAAVGIVKVPTEIDLGVGIEKNHAVGTKAIVAITPGFRNQGSIESGALRRPKSLSLRSEEIHDQKVIPCGGGFDDGKSGEV
jgi:hypothetical protein